MATTKRPLALITGASAGIGREYARALARRGGYDLVLVARRLERLEELKAELEGGSPALTATVIECDLIDKRAREDMLAAVDSLSQPVSLLINNAGFGSLGTFIASDPDWEERMVQLNCVAPVVLTRRFLPKMSERREGAVIHVASTAAFQPMPYMATYGATKAFLLSFSTALACEVGRTGVTVLAHCPGPTESEFHTVVGLPEKLSHLPAMTAEQAVEQALHALERRRSLIINGARNNALAALNRLLPRRAAAAAVEVILRRHV